MANARELLERRKRRNRAQIAKRRGARPRLSVFRSGRHIYAQVVDDASGTTLAAASTVEKGLRGKPGGDAEAAVQVGKLIGERAREAGVSEVVFDRGGYKYHGRVKALAEAAREAGLSF